MQLANRRRQKSKAVAAAPSRDSELVDILILSLAGLSFALFEIVHFANASVLQQMFAP